MKYCIGLMSGTSLDGVDAVLIKIKNSGIETEYEELFFECFKIPEDIKDEIYMSMDPKTSDVSLICSLNYKLGHLFGNICLELCENAGISMEEIEFIASHGQTIYHNPYYNGNLIPSTLQIGEPSIIAYKTNTTVISNFRGEDIAAGGQGAPLVPYVDYILFNKYRRNIAIHNIGGIANTTIIPEDGDKDKIIAFDTGPGNMIIDGLCLELFGLEYDKDGEIAGRGNKNEELLEKMMNHEFLKKSPPKSTGREDFGIQYVKELIIRNSDMKPEDLVRTATEFTAKSMAESYKTYILKHMDLSEVILCGGGAYNLTLKNCIQRYLTGIKVSTMEDYHMNSFSKEAVAFAILGNDCLGNIKNNIKSATGAEAYVVLGDITYA